MVWSLMFVFLATLIRAFLGVIKKGSINLFPENFIFIRCLSETELCSVYSSFAMKKLAERLNLPLRLNTAY